jgi:hypothetical protein
MDSRITSTGEGPAYSPEGLAAPQQRADARESLIAQTGAPSVEEITPEEIGQQQSYLNRTRGVIQQIRYQGVPDSQVLARAAEYGATQSQDTAFDAEQNRVSDAPAAPPRAEEKTQESGGFFSRLFRKVAGAVTGAHDAAPVDRSERKGGGTDQISLPLGNTMVTLRGVDIIDLDYNVRPKEEHEQMRKEFNSKYRKAFLKSLEKDPEKVAALRRAGLGDSDFQLLHNGKVPPGYQVHHKIPIDDNGTNDFSNMVLIKNDPAHKAITNHQMHLTEGMQEGDTRSLKWPVPVGFVYPPDPSYVTTAPA